MRMMQTNTEHFLLLRAGVAQQRTYGVLRMVLMTVWQ